eukprot:510325-Alexandrium_andersonii.AAC.1
MDKQREREAASPRVAAHPSGQRVRRRRPHAEAALRVERAVAPPRTSLGSLAPEPGCPTAISGLRRLREADGRRG